MRGFSLIELMIVITIVGITTVAVAWAVLEDEKRPNITLKKDDWQCTKYETRTHLQLIGKVLMPMTEDVCVEYRRIGG